MNLAQPLRTSRLSPLLISTLLAAIIAHGIIFAPLPIFIQAWAVLILTGLLPGLLLVEWLVGGRADSPLDVWERAIYSIGAGAAIIVLTMLLLSYLPGPILRWQTFVAFDAILLILAAAIAIRGPISTPPSEPLPDWEPVWTTVSKQWFVAGLLSILVVAGFLRFYQLGYSEFQGDETRVLLRTAEAIQGFNDTIYIHKKGPGEIMLPASIYAMLDRLNEASARLPFTLLNITGLFAIFLLGWRMFGAVAGWSAAIILTLDGYFVGFARIVQYQSMVFCLVVLSVLIFYRLVRVPKLLPNYLSLAAIFLATAMLAHYEGGLAFFPALFLLVMLWRRGVSLARLGQAVIAPILIGAAILGLFYIPFVLHPSFASTYNYLADSRIGSSFPYNNLQDFFIRTTLYSTTYYFVLMVLATLLGLARVYWQNWPRGVAIAAIALLFVGMGVTVTQPSWLWIGGQDHTWLFFALALTLAWFAPRIRLEERTIWIWFGLAMLFMLFVVQLPNTHVYGFVIPWALVVGMTIEVGYRIVASKLSLSQARMVGSVTAAALILLFANYAAMYFTMGNLEVLRNWRTMRPQGYWVAYEMPTSHSIFGFPLTNGWKAVGALIADGVIDAPFDVHGKDAVADWYTRGQGYCPREPYYFLWHDAVEPGDLDSHREMRDNIEQWGYQLFGEVTINDEPRLAIYKIGDKLYEGEITPQLFRGEDYIQRFDTELSGPIFERDGVTAIPHIEKPVNFHFGDSIRLVGYTLHGQDNIPGGHVNLTLYWQADQKPTQKQTIFAQVIDRNDAYKAGEAGGEPVCSTLPTTEWEPGQIIADRYTIPLAEDARLTTYTLLIGMSGEGGNLEITTPEGNSLGDAIGLDEVRVTQP